ncbi:pyrimidine/purine nucleoside phosphorylase [Acinetobacter sp. I-MWF]|uniref:pyrimidine/purine nucleoside phosphorylase n=1 Tax=Acinetobacter sp. I-MWF TaxID=2940517 RepID=UPI0021C97B14|nr:pyrimidine/purine nucleoside phosphorylase [Acinetobacter sp. I-MWF]MCT9977756.1 pyrimidine/purine nucleoside phosphorylase [Acinetobacter sp. I-MWF]
MTEQFDFISVKKKANVHFNGASISHVIVLKDGTKKTLGVILPSENPLTFKTHLTKRIEIIAGECSVQIGHKPDIKIYKSGESFQILALSQFKIQTNTIVDYISHFK